MERAGEFIKGKVEMRGKGQRSKGAI